MIPTIIAPRGGNSGAKTVVAGNSRAPGLPAAPDGNVVRLTFGPGPRQPAEAARFNQRLVERLAESVLFHEFQRAFEDAMGLPLTLRPVESLQLAHVHSEHQNGFCALMSGSARACGACLAAQERACRSVAAAPGTVTCRLGLRETAVAVKAGSQTIAYLQTGQVFFNRPTARQTQRALRLMKSWGVEVDGGEAARLYHKTPVVGQREYESGARLLQFFANQLGPLAGQITLLEQTAEPAQIARARHFMQEQHREKLSLADVADAAGMSRCYFCKAFKKVTGFNVTQYLSCVRVTEAKKLLMNLNYRVTEIAFEVGFQSLTHFNRVFRNIVGESPSEYRRHLQHG